jgi:hypothetical protein
MGEGVRGRRPEAGRGGDPAAAAAAVPDLPFPVVGGLGYTRAPLRAIFY